MNESHAYDCGSLVDSQASSTLLAAALLGLVGAGCGAPSPDDERAPLEVGSASSRMVTDDDDELTLQGLSGNGLSTNGMGTNGMGTNGLSTSGLSTAGMSASEFVDWFNEDPALAKTVMRYVVACAVAQGAQLSWTNPVTGTAYLWPGKLGLTPGWASGAPATELEQQLITACLAAHTNKYGMRVPFSLQGVSSTGAPIPVEPLEFVTFATREACFFGNLFQGEGIFAGNDSVLPDTHSSVRACGLVSSFSADPCLPIQHAASCSELCTSDPLGDYFVSCTWNGKTYRALTTRIQTLDVYVCGDGQCQLSESCGLGLTPNNCMDCGPCP